MSGRFPITAPIAFALCLIASIPASAQPASSTRPTRHYPPATAPTDAMPREAVDAIDKKELGPKYDPAKADAYYEIHKVLEKYFAAKSAEDRRVFTQWIDSFGVDPNVVGRLCRVHLQWPALDPGCYYVNDKVGPHSVKYFLGIPKGYDRATKWPLVVMLPTATAFVTDPKPDADAVAKLYNDWINAELTKHPDALVLMPLLNLNEGWGPGYGGMNSVIQAMYHATTRANVDPARVYLVGVDTSAHAVWNLGLHYTTYFAALNPFAGAATSDWQRMRLMNLRNTYVVTWHDTADDVIKVDQARQLVNILRRMKCDVDYDETHNVGHAPSTDVVQRAYDKLRSRTRDLYPKEVHLQSNRPDTMFNRLDWVQLYQELRPGPDQTLFFRHGTMTVSANAMSIQAAYANNRVEARTDNVESMRFYFNDQMVDFTKPVTVSINRNVRFQGMLKPSLDEMLKDQLDLGRGWRYFTAVVDIDFGEPATRPATRAATRPIPKIVP